MTATQRLRNLSASLEQELDRNILPFWYQTMDQRGGFAGSVANDNTVKPDAPKGVVMHARHLWAYSTAWMERGRPLERQAAAHALRFLTGPLLDARHRGFWWQVVRGRPSTKRKVIYGQAFAVYGLAQHHRATGDTEALALALETFLLLERWARDRQLGGYYEAVTRDWRKPLIQPLSDVDIPCAKSMNTNLHVLEAYTALYLATRRDDVREALESLIGVFERNILVSPEHLGLYFDHEWRSLTTHVSYGHDIEASWLLAEAAHVLGRASPASLPLARKTLGLLRENNGSLPNEFHEGRLDTDRVWWVQAEALVGLVNAFEMTRDEAYLDAAETLWAFIEKHLIDREHGEWFWLVDAQGRPDPDRPKGGLWKTCYHNGRACMEIMQRTRRWKE